MNILKLLLSILITFFFYSCNSGNDDRREYADDDRPRNDRERDRNRNDPDRNVDPRDRNYTDERDRKDLDPENRDRTDNFPERQNEANPLMEIMEKYNRYLLNENWVGLVTFMYPEIAGGQAKDQIAQELAGKFHNDINDIVSDKSTIDHVSEIINVDGNQYRLQQAWEQQL